MCPVAPLRGWDAAGHIHGWRSGRGRTLHRDGGRAHWGLLVSRRVFFLSFPCWCPIFPLLLMVLWGKLLSVTLVGAGPVGISWRQWEIPQGAALLQSACGQNSRCPKDAQRSSAQTRQFWGGGKRHHRDLIPGFRFQRGIFTLLILLTPSGCNSWHYPAAFPNP